MASVPDESDERVASRSGPGNLTPGQWALLGLTLLAAALRFGTLAKQSLWLDEVATMNVLDGNASGLLGRIADSESTPPFYYVLTWAWVQLAGEGELAVRSVSALCGTATVPVAWLIGRRYSERVALCAAALATVNPNLFYYAQEHRAYALLILLAGVATLLWLRALDDPRGGRLGAWAAVAGLALMTHYFAVFLIVPQAVWLLWRSRAARPVVLSTAAVGVVGAVLLPLVAAQRQDTRQDWISDRPLTTRFAEVPKQFLVGIDGPAENLAGALAVCLVALALLVFLRRSTSAERLGAARLSGLTLVALALPLALSLSGVIDVYNGRNTVVAMVPALTVIAVAFGSRASGRIGALLATGLLGLSAVVLAGVLSDPAYQRADWRAVAEGLRSPGVDRLVATAPNESRTLAHYLPGEAVKGIQTDVREIAVVVQEGATWEPRLMPSAFSQVSTRRSDGFETVRFTSALPMRVDQAAIRLALRMPKADLFRQSGN